MADGKTRNGRFWAVALDRAHLGLWDWNLSTGDCYYSPTWSKMLGYAEGELANTADLWLTLTHPDDRQRAMDSGDRHIAGQTESIETELRLKHKDGHWVWVLDRGGIVERDADGKPRRLMGVQTDITKQKEAEAALEQVNIRFRLALAASGTGIWHHDIGTNKSYWDARSREIFGLVAEKDEVTADLWHTFLHPDDKEATEQAHQVSAGSDRVVAVQYRIVRRDGVVRHVESLVRFIAGVGSAGQILGTVRDITEEKQRAAELAYAAEHDALTGLLNRAAFDRLLGDYIGTQRRLPLAVFYVDLDYFKALNDFAGHAAGDLALKGVAAGILASLPPSAHAARLGGDEFALLVPNCDDACAERLARAVLAAVRDADLGLAVPSRRLAASVGIAFVRDANITVADALACADDACYAAKAGGRDRFAVFSPKAVSGSGGLNAARLAADTVDAMEDGRLKLYGQEIHKLDRPWAESRHVEVLARLAGRDGRMIPPGDFIPVAERFGIAARLDRWIIRTALMRHAQAMRSGAISLGFNLSAQTLSDPQLWDFVDAAIAETGAPPTGIGFEITETAAVTNFDAAEQFVRRARERRCRVSLDDFGAGMSSFEYLRRFPIDAIKIDGSFIEHIADSRFDREIVSAISGIARSMGAAVVAEKVEEKAALEILRSMGVTYAQGFLLHRPEPLEAIVARATGGLPQKRFG
ncbi:MULTISPECIES: EAL domain-containing protein [unclassified Mesorhizobium]|uniref:EAL domain-containing protein n=4 Tax=Mesorhizobium TaxID=68287 RepID=UPI000BAE718B|nr:MULTISPECIES: EAL domain-containing protein [unclassified Mesorhizobium]TGT56845.1 EAL domain-containing protein [Mesorhizobium sp. M00.F.Ca.ET.170.01.1.1]AZO08611.1 EAL domain-containing protein [Mesorhizobium sp. M3A.F.Ca.ET.080.04.2.1]PBB85491.1 GGDEF domain-containing protein [Mesorhizobium sp. WSM3876]RWB71728.1 MAG: EAL domain-containing protein [Mesorhizobium sp.]RWB85020.1 MAG: EAL domain-containing protein [Mesorhizobium sp.]